MGVDLVVSLQTSSEKEMWFDSTKILTDKNATKLTVVEDAVLAVLLRKQKDRQKRDLRFAKSGPFDVRSQPSSMAISAFLNTGLNRGGLPSLGDVREGDTSRTVP